MLGSSREASLSFWLSWCVPGLVYRALGFPPQFFTVMFAVPRIVGYLSHWRESLSDPDTKIMRPQEDYWVSTVDRTILAQLSLFHPMSCWIRAPD
jgi:hypothetical protein